MILLKHRVQVANCPETYKGNTKTGERARKRYWEVLTELPL